MKKETNTQKTIMFSANNFELISGFHEALGSKNFSDTVNLLIERAFDNVNSTDNLYEQFSSKINELSKEIRSIKDESKKDTNRLISIYNTGFRLQAKTYGIVRKAEESRATFDDRNWNNVDPETQKSRVRSNLVCDEIEKRTIKQEFENLKKEDNSL